MTKIHKIFKPDRNCILYNGDCFDLLKSIPDEYFQLTLSSPPYCMGKEYESSRSYADFIDFHEKIIPELCRVTAVGGSICWQVGYHVKDSIVTPLDYLAYNIFSKQKDLFLRNRIIWTFGHGLHGRNRFSGRHEVVLWLTKGDDYKFNLDSIRIEQKYPGKRFYKGDKKGEYSSNPKGKNPSDIWDIPVVNANHVEKTSHPCQFPHALAQRFILALTDKNDFVFDPFMGSGTTAAASVTEQRRFVGSELYKSYWSIAKGRVKAAIKGDLKFRPHNKPIMVPDPNTAVANKPIV